jgi:hypothetical protein
MGHEDMEDRRKDCQLEFDRIWERLSKGEHRFEDIANGAHITDIRVTKLETNMINLIKSMSGLTKSIWAAVVALVTIGMGFIIWYIQQL